MKTLQSQKAIIDMRIEAINNKIKHVKKESQKRALEYRKTELLNKKNTLWREFLHGGSYELQN